MYSKSQYNNNELLFRSQMKPDTEMGILATCFACIKILFTINALPNVSLVAFIKSISHSSSIHTRCSIERQHFEESTYPSMKFHMMKYRDFLDMILDVSPK